MKTLILKPQHSVMGSRLILAALACLMPAGAALKPLAPRQSVSLDGTWQIEQGGMDAPPPAFSRTIPVPGLVDMATPAFTEVGKVSPQRQAFWYRRSFRVDAAIPEIALLKLHKARYGSSVWLNGKLLGEHMPCFTPVEFDARPLLKSGDNEVLIRLGANRESIPNDQPSGWDFENICSPRASMIRWNSSCPERPICATCRPCRIRLRKPSEWWWKQSPVRSLRSSSSVRRCSPTKAGNPLESLFQTR